jgi:hypothetical protein
MNAPLENRTRHALTCALFATAVTALAAGPALEYSRIYYEHAAYHFDSSAYRWGAVATYRSLQSHGLGAALAGALHGKDSLDVVLRLLVAPSSLTQLYGHLVVALPFLWLFLFLLAGLVLDRTGSAPLALLACTPILAFPLVYRPYLGLADCLPETSAIGLMGTALVCWLRSDGLTKRIWAAGCGLSLGLLVWQRTVWAFYVVLVLIPPVVVALVRPRMAGRNVAGLAALLTPLALLGGALWAVQGTMLYRYYAVVGYGYASPWRVLERLYGFCTFLGVPGIPLLLGAAVALAALWPPGERERYGVTTAAWFMVGMPLAVVASRAVYVGFVWLWIPPLMLLPAVLLGAGRGIRSQVAVGLLATISLSMVGYAHARIANEPIDWLETKQRPLFDAVIQALPARPLRIQFLVNEWDLLFLNQAYFDAGRRGWDAGPALVSQHDSYYTASFGSRGPEEIAQMLAHTLEGSQEMWVVGYCNPAAIDRTESIVRDGPTIARPTLRLLNEHVAKSEAWQRWRRLYLRPIGCVTVYRYVPGRVSAP